MRAPRWRWRYSFRSITTLVILAVWLTWTAAHLPDNGNDNYELPVDLGQLAADINAGHVTSIVTHTGNTRVDIFYRYPDTASAEGWSYQHTGCHLPTQTDIHGLLESYPVVPSALATVHFERLPQPGLRLRVRSVLLFLLQSLVPPAVAVGIGLWVYRIMSSLLTRYSHRRAIRR